MYYCVLLYQWTYIFRLSIFTSSFFITIIHVFYYYLFLKFSTIDKRGLIYLLLRNFFYFLRLNVSFIKEYRYRYIYIDYRIIKNNHWDFIFFHFNMLWQWLFVFRSIRFSFLFYWKNKKYCLVYPIVYKMQIFAQGYVEEFLVWFIAKKINRNCISIKKYSKSKMFSYCMK